MKAYGNIVSFRDLQEETDEALTLFGNKDAKSIAILKPYLEYEVEYQGKIAELMSNFPLDKTIQGEVRKKQFVKLFGEILKLRNILTSFDEFAENEAISERDIQDYQSIYLDIHDEFRGEIGVDREIVNDDLVFEIELIKQIEVNVDYILMLVEQALKEGQKDKEKSKENREKISCTVDSSLALRKKKNLIDDFIDSVSAEKDVREDWRKFIENARSRELTEIANKEKLKHEKTKQFIENAFRDGYLSTTGTAIGELLPHLTMFGPGAAYAETKQRVTKKLVEFFNRFEGSA